MQNSQHIYQQHIEKEKTNNIVHDDNQIQDTKNEKIEYEKSEDDKELERDGDLEILEEEDLESENSGEILEIE